MLRNEAAFFFKSSGRPWRLMVIIVNGVDVQYIVCFFHEGRVEFDVAFVLLLMVEMGTGSNRF